MIKVYWRRSNYPGKSSRSRPNKKYSFSARDVEDGMKFLESLSARTARPEVRRAISIATQQLQKAAGQTVGAALQKLAKSNPPKL